MKRLLVAVVGALAALALAAPASATTVVITVTCTEATFSYSAFPTNIQSSAVQTVVINGGVPLTSTVQFQSETFVSTMSLSISGTATVTATSNWTAHQSGEETTTETVECGGTTDGTDGTDGTTEGTDGTTEGTTEGTDGTWGTTEGTDGTTNGTTDDDTGGVDVSTTGGTEPGGELPFTGLPIWIPILLAGALLASGAFLLRRKRDAS